MSDATKSESKPARAASRAKPRTKPVDAPSDEADDFGAGIVEEPPKPAPAAVESKAPDAPPMRATTPPPPRPRPEADGEPRRPHAPSQPIDPIEHGFDAETNSRYEEIKRGNTYITELQHMTIAQLQKAARDEGVPREEIVGLKK